MIRSMLIRFVLCYLMTAAIVARPLPGGIKKRKITERQMEDVQLSGTGMFLTGSIATQCTRRSYSYCGDSSGNRLSSGYTPHCFFYPTPQAIVRVDRNSFAHFHCFVWLFSLGVDTDHHIHILHPCRQRRRCTRWRRRHQILFLQWHTPVERQRNSLHFW